MQFPPTAPVFNRPAYAAVSPKKPLSPEKKLDPSPQAPPKVPADSPTHFATTPKWVATREEEPNSTGFGSKRGGDDRGYDGHRTYGTKSGTPAEESSHVDVPQRAAVGVPVGVVGSGSQRVGGQELCAEGALVAGAELDQAGGVGALPRVPEPGDRRGRSAATRPRCHRAACAHARSAAASTEASSTAQTWVRSP